MKIVSLTEVEKIDVDMKGACGAMKQVPISGADGSPSYAFRVFTLEPCGRTPFHSHAFEHLNYIIDGQGVVVNQAEEETAVSKGDFVLVLPGEKHQYRNASEDKDLVFICAVPTAYE